MLHTKQESLDYSREATSALGVPTGGGTRASASPFARLPTVCGGAGESGGDGDGYVVVEPRSGLLSYVRKFSVFWWIFFNDGIY